MLDEAFVVLSRSPALTIMEAAIFTIVTQFKTCAGKDGSTSTLSKDEFQNLVISQLPNYVKVDLTSSSSESLPADSYVCFPSTTSYAVDTEDALVEDATCVRALAVRTCCWSYSEWAYGSSSSSSVVSRITLFNNIILM